MLINYKAAIILLILLFLFYKLNSIAVLLADIGLETKLLNNIKIYRKKKLLNKL